MSDKKQNTMQTVNGHQVIVHLMDGFGSFPIKGTIMRKPPKENRPLRYEIWMANGRMLPLRESQWDLVLEENPK